MAWPKGRKRTKENKEKTGKATKKYFSNPLARKKHSIAMKKYYSNPKAREKVSRRVKKYWHTHPKFAKEIDRKITEWWKEHPNIKEERSTTLKNLFMKNPNKLKNFLKYGKNPNKLRFKTKQKFLVRSKGEKQIADFLYKNKISSSYESKTLIFKEEGQICVPDFYLPKHKTYIEFYGG